MSTQNDGPLLDALRGARWPARRTVGTALPGMHRSQQRGTSGEFTEYRLYRQGDDPRRLDWKLLARSDRAFVRLTDDHAVVSTWFALDASLSMAYPESRSSAEGPTSKWAMARSLAVGLAAVAHASGDPVGVVTTGANGPQRMTARTRRGTVGELARLLDGVAVGGEPALSPLLTAIPVRARLVILTDLLGDAHDLLRVAAQRSAAGAIVECVHVVAREELELPSGAFLARDPEGASEQRSMDRRLHAGYRQHFDAFRAECAQQWRASGAGYIEARTDVSATRLVRQIIAGSGRDIVSSAATATMST
jgi:uncharacterized protein (DUF58 family)